MSESFLLIFSPIHFFEARTMRVSALEPASFVLQCCLVNFKIYVSFLIIRQFLKSTLASILNEKSILKSSFYE